MSSLGKIVYNQPAGHVDANESIEAAVIREVLEETGIKFKPTALVGTYLLNPAENEHYYLRYCFTGYVQAPVEIKPIDKDIIAAHWMSIEQILDILPQHRSGLIVECFKDYLSGKRFPLNGLNFSNNEQALQKQGLEFLKNHKP